MHAFYILNVICFERIVLLVERQTKVSESYAENSDTHHDENIIYMYDEYATQYSNIY